MTQLAKRLLASKILRVGFSIVLIWLAFRRIDVGSLGAELVKVPWWFVALMMILYAAGAVLGSARWAFLVLKQVNIADVLAFTRANYIGMFYSLFLSSSVGGDAVKWIYLGRRYKDMSRLRLASGVVLDRVVGFSAFCLMAFGAMVLGKIVKFNFPDFLFWLFLGLFVGVGLFYLVLWLTDIERLMQRWVWGERLLKVIDVVKKSNKKRLVAAVGVSVVLQIIWTLPVWFYSLVFRAGMSLLSVYVLIPVIGLILVLPISVAGFGAREQLFLYFFRPLGIADEKILLVSAFGGVLTVLNSLFGGLFLLI